MPEAARSPGSTRAACFTSARGAPGRSPGPVAYGQGGTEPTLTDANLVLGRLDPGYFLGGCDAARPESCPRAPLARARRRARLSAKQAALAAVRTADENMANAIRLIAVERGARRARVRR